MKYTEMNFVEVKCVIRDLEELRLDLHKLGYCLSCFDGSFIMYTPNGDVAISMFGFQGLMEFTDDNVKLENSALLSLIHEMVPWTMDHNCSSIKDMCTQDEVEILEICQSLEKDVCKPGQPRTLRKVNSLTDQLEALASKTTGRLIGLDECW